MRIGRGSEFAFLQYAKKKKKTSRKNARLRRGFAACGNKARQKGGWGKNETPPLNFFSKKHFAKRCYFTGFYTLYQGPFSTPEHAKLSLKGNKNGIFRYTMASNL
jgi:hypothetical protein